jgi:hypothetical protein
MGKPGYCDCGRRIVVIRRSGFRTFKIGKPADNSHDLCSKCFKAQRDRDLAVAHNTARLNLAAESS